MSFATGCVLTTVAGGKYSTVPPNTLFSARYYIARCAAPPDIIIMWCRAGTHTLALSGSRLFPFFCLAAFGSSTRQRAFYRRKQRTIVRTKQLEGKTAPQAILGDAPVRQTTTDKVVTPFEGHGRRTDRIGKHDFHVEASGEHTVAVPLPLRENVAASLTKYMQLPASQYALIPLPFGASLERVRERLPLEGGGELFELIVPYVNIPGVVSVQPVVMCTVRSLPDQVVIEGTECTLRGADAFKYRLNDRFCFSVRATLTWLDEDSTRSIDIASTIKVDVDPPTIFRKLMPKKWLEHLGSTMVGATLRYLQGGFIRSLAKEYLAWEADPDHREARARLL
ncbi:unnamed protein product [Prorocentrum cordatum]|uniref:DUF1997 domain-containing protein n=1 Tax=Prorocentrum cordatum TaxID=2364126 RepID=A0ABN9TGE4_9DINO|nr:unnamed protein product [Polarella glacialis]